MSGLTAEEIKERVIHYSNEIYNKKNLDAGDEDYSPDTVRHFPMTEETIRGPEACKERVRYLWAAFPDIRFNIIVATILTTLFLAACGTLTATPEPETPTATPTPEPPTVTPVPPAQVHSEIFELSETHVITDFGFSIDYPEGWYAGTRDTVTNISQLERDHERNFGGNLAPSGYLVIVDHRDMDFMRNLGLSSDPSLEDLLELNIDYFNLEDPEVSETEIFGVPALCAMADKLFETVMKCGGFIADEAFLVSVKAPTEEKFDQLLVIWEEMRRSIRPMSGGDLGGPT